MTGHLLRDLHADADRNPLGNVSPHRIAELREERDHLAASARRGRDRKVAKLDALIAELEAALEARS